MLETLKKYMTEDERSQMDALVPAVKAKKKQKRRFDGARQNRLTSDWQSSNLGINNVLRSDLRALRQRSRDLQKNDPYVKRFIRLAKLNVIGRGISFQAKTSGRTIGTDAKLTSHIEAAFKEWGKAKNCSLSKKLSWTQAQKLFVTHLLRDGEALVRIVLTDKNRFGIALKFYSPQWLDEMYNDTRPGGNRVIMSVEVNDDDEPVAYWLTPPADNYPLARRERYRFRVPAEEMIHGFDIFESEDEARGIPETHASMFRLKMLNGFEEAEVVAARIEASKMGFYIPPVDENDTASDEDDEGNEFRPIEEVEPGTLTQLPPGYDFKTFDPTHPNPNADGFKKFVLRGAGAGLNLSYHTLAGDLEAVNYSSARIGSLDDRDYWTDLQDFVIENFCERIYAAWLEAAFLNNALDISAKDYDRLKEPTFRGRGWTWVDPQKEATAHVVGLQNKFETLTSVLAEKGIDIEEHFETLKKERELAKTYGIDLEELYNPKKPMATEEKPKRSFTNGEYHEDESDSLPS